MDKIDENTLRELIERQEQIIARQDQLISRQEIWDAIVSYTRGMDRLDPEFVISAFHPDAQDDHGTFCGNREELAETGMAMHGAENSKTHHFLTNHYCELDGETAHTETYFLYCGAQAKGPTDVLGGRYLDDLERRNGDWKIANRLCFIEWSSALPEAYDTGTTPSRSALESFMDPRSQRSREDASYIRPLPVSTEKRSSDLLAIV